MAKNKGGRPKVSLAKRTFLVEQAMKYGAKGAAARVGVSSDTLKNYAIQAGTPLSKRADYLLTNRVLPAVRRGVSISHACRESNLAISTGWRKVSAWVEQGLLVRVGTRYMSPELAQDLGYIPKPEEVSRDSTWSGSGEEGDIPTL